LCKKPKLDPEAAHYWGYSKTLSTKKNDLSGRCEFDTASQLETNSLHLLDLSAARYKTKSLCQSKIPLSDLVDKDIQIAEPRQLVTPKRQQE
jgi:hypothetical protein